MLQKLIEIGFKKVGHWYLTPANKLQFELDEIAKSKSEVVYAFVVDGEVYYVGKTDHTMKGRMTNYKNGKEDGKSGTTNKKIRKKISEFLNIQQKVDIYILADTFLDFKGFQVSLSSGIEPSLIRALNQETTWNIKHTDNKGFKPVKQKTENHAKGFGSEFTCNLKQENYSKGLFSINTAVADNLLPLTSNTNVSLQLGRNGREIKGKFTRSGNRRFINGSNELLDWYKLNFKLGDILKFQIISPTNFILFSDN